MHVLASHAVLPAFRSGADACAWRQQGEVLVAVLADGAGTAPEAAEAAQRAVEALCAGYLGRAPEATPLQALLAAARAVHDDLLAESRRRFGDARMVAAFAAVAVEGGRLAGAWAGDARIYRLRAGGLRQLNYDHVDEEMPHLLTSALGLPGAFWPGYFTDQLEDGDTLLLCSDGVWSVLDPSATLRAGLGADVLVERAAAAQGRGALDDCAAVVVHLPEVGALAAEKARDLPIPGRLRVGDRVDGFTLCEALDADARVWLAAGAAGRRAVMKFAPQEAAANEALLMHFLRGMRHASTLPAGQFVPAEIPADASARYYLMEHVDAPSLADELGRRRLAADEGAALLRFLAGAARRLLDRRLVHGDLSPGNILFTGDPAAPSFRLVDLGGMASVGDAATRAGAPAYRAPERFHGAPADVQGEIFSIGASVYRALAGVPPFGDIEPFQHPQFRPARPLGELNPGVPAWLEAVVMRCIAITPEGRYRSLEALQADLDHPERVETADRRAAERRRAEDHRFRAVLIAGLLALLAGLVVPML